MGLFGFIGDVASASVKLALTPVAVVKDVVAVVGGEEPENTKDLIVSAGNDLDDSLDEIIP